MRLRVVLLTICALAGLAALVPGRASLAGWGDDPAPQAAPERPADSRPEAGEPQSDAEKEAQRLAGLSETDLVDKPEWEKYAFNLPYADGSGYLRFTDLARSGKPFILVWWVSDCSACHLQLPYVQQLERMVERGEQDVWVVSVNIDGEDAPCLRYMKDKKISFSVLRDPRARRTDGFYKVRDLGTPVTYVFKPGGQYVDRLSGFTKGYPDKVLGMLDLEDQASGSGDVRASGRSESRFD